MVFPDYQEMLLGIAQAYLIGCIIDFSDSLSTGRNMIQEYFSPNHQQREKTNIFEWLDYCVFHGALLFVSLQMHCISNFQFLLLNNSHVDISNLYNTNTNEIVIKRSENLVFRSVFSTWL